MNTSRYMDCVRWLVCLCFLLTGTATMAGEKITYHHFDALGSPVAATNEQGNVIWRETYQPYGERIQKSPAAAGNTRWHTGHVLDPETGLQYAGARYYDPVIGRFMGVDPQDYEEGQLHTYNRYAYGANNPYKYVDPDGQKLLFALLLWTGAEGANLAIEANSPPPPGCGGSCAVPSGFLLGGGPSLGRGAGLTARLLAGDDIANNTVNWTLGTSKTMAKWASQMEKRGWTPAQITKAIEKGKPYPAENLVNKGNPATRYVHPETGRSVVIDNTTKEIIHVGGDGFKY